MKEQFPIFKNKKIHYLDNAATSQKPQTVLDDMLEYYEKYNGNPGRGSHELAIISSSIVQNSRDTVKEFIGANNSSEIIFTKNSTESINIVAYCYGLENLQKNDEIILAITNHHANIVPWQYVARKTGAIIKYIYLDEYGNLDINDFKYKLTDKTKIVALSAVVNTTGVIQDFHTVIELAHNKNAVVVLDAAQSIGHFKHEVAKWDVDFMVFSGHKIYSAMGIGVLYGKKHLLDAMPPFIYGGDMIEYVEEQKSTFKELPTKFEGGTLNVEGILSLKSAINWLNNTTYEIIKNHEDKLMLHTMFALKSFKNIEIYHDINVNKVGIIAFNYRNIHSHDVAFVLDNFGVAIRSGKHCTEPLMRYLDINSCCRISFGIYNTMEDVDMLIKGLKKVEELFGD